MNLPPVLMCQEIIDDTINQHSYVIKAATRLAVRDIENREDTLADFNDHVGCIDYEHKRYSDMTYKGETVIRTYAPEIEYKRNIIQRPISEIRGDTEVKDLKDGRILVVSTYVEASGTTTIKQIIEEVWKRKLIPARTSYGH